MAQKLICAELGTTGCPFQVVAENTDEVVHHGLDHAKRVHNMETTPELESNVKNTIKPA
jgi:predicted small metal-binding protein